MHSGSTASISNNLSYFQLDGSSQRDSPGDLRAPDTRSLFELVSQWLEEEKSKRSKGRFHRPQFRSHSHNKSTEVARGESAETLPHEDGAPDEDIALEKLERILSGFSSTLQRTPKLRPQGSPVLTRKGSLAQKLMKPSTATSSDTEGKDSSVLVPNVEASLDNSKTLAYSGGSSEDETTDPAKRRDADAWVTFKQEILRITHTLKLRGWRKLPLERASDIDVARLSGALTNAVYVVKPPKHLPELQTGTGSTKPPVQLLLRIYGPQVEHLIDRENELAILRRLARKHIGPRLLGSFSNGRFEEFLHARTLTAEDLRIPDTSKQIAKRMRELHDGIDLLEAEYETGPSVFVNWDKWVDRVEKVITWLDQQVHAKEAGRLPPPRERYVKRGLICGVEWPVFRKAVEKYRQQLLRESGGEEGVKNRLVFAHNDTQYGNLMRLTPSGESPLLHPANEHRQLVVIDFEYANPNTAGLEFANHFTEWCYNYHHPQRGYACNTNAYPTPEEQYRFVRAYVMHRAESSASGTPKMDGREKTNIPDFMLDARTPQGTTSNLTDYELEEKAREQAIESQIQKLLHETRLWRLANTAQWVAWGIVQAKVPELDEPSKKSVAAQLVDKVKGAFHPHSDALDEEEKQLQEDAKHDRPEGREQEEAHEEGEEHEEEDFDYLAYTQERAMFFWGDCLQMGIIKEDELPEGTRKMVKVVKY